MAIHYDNAQAAASAIVDQLENVRGEEGVDPLARLVQQSLAGFDDTAKMCSLKKVTVPKFGAEWRFPSDHLPIGCIVNGKNIVSWNVMNDKYMEWVTEKDSQGLNGSLITELDKPVIGKPGFTQRDLVVLEDILLMLQIPGSPKHVLALQEVSEPLILELVVALPENYQIILQSGPFVDRSQCILDQNIAIIDTDAFEYIPDLSRPQYSGVFSGDQSSRHIMDIIFEAKDTKEKFRIVNAHVPGDPSIPSRDEFARHVTHPDLGSEDLNEVRKHCITVALGDMNFDEIKMQRAFDIAGAGHEDPLFVRVSPYRTNVGGNFDVEGDELCAKAIDHFFVSTSVDGTPTQVGGMSYKDVYPLRCQVNHLELILNLFKRHTRG